ncbi:hypothetical protein ACWGHM_41395 [Streptomyces sp. NPDC054904]
MYEVSRYGLPVHVPAPVPVSSERESLPRRTPGLEWRRAEEGLPRPEPDVRPGGIGPVAPALWRPADAARVLAALRRLSEERLSGEGA